MTIWTPKGGLLMANIIKPSGWKGKKEYPFWTKDSVYGMKYKCSACGKEVLGVSGDPLHNHYENCPKILKRDVNTERGATNALQTKP